MSRDTQNTWLNKVFSSRTYHVDKQVTWLTMPHETIWILLLCMYIHVSLGVCEYVYTCISGGMRVCIYMYLWGYASMYIHVSLGVCEYAYTCISGGMWVCIYMYLWGYVSMYNNLRDLSKTDVMCTLSNVRWFYLTKWHQYSSKDNQLHSLCLIM